MFSRYQRVLFLCCVVCTTQYVTGNFSDGETPLIKYNIYNVGHDRESNAIFIEKKSNLIKWIENSAELMHNPKAVFGSELQSKMDNIIQTKHYNYIIKRIHKLSQMRASSLSDMKNYHTLNHVYTVKNIYNNTIYYHVECPGYGVQIKVDLDEGGVKEPKSIKLRCQYFRILVRVTLEVFRVDFFKFVELPSEVVQDNDIVVYGDTIIRDSDILKFAFVNKTHSINYNRRHQYKCKTFVQNKTINNIAHLYNSNVHILNDNIFCITQKPLSTSALLKKFNCTNDLWFTLLHELSHYFISPCHIDIELLKSFSTSRSLDFKSYVSLVQMWKSNDYNYHCQKQTDVTPQPVHVSSALPQLNTTHDTSVNKSIETTSSWITQMMDNNETVTSTQTPLYS